MPFVWTNPQLVRFEDDDAGKQALGQMRYTQLLHSCLVRQVPAFTRIDN
jgi:hypothetical protein